ncbi:MAG: hypothetical protein AB7R99_18790 [Pseudonocardia sp.]
MLKKIIVVAAVVAAGALAASSLAFADTDQEKHQVSHEGNGIGEGNNKGEGNSENPDTLLCNLGLAIHDEPNEEFHAADPCESTGEAYGQKTEQYHSND